MRLQRSQEQKDLGMSELSFGVQMLKKTYDLLWTKKKLPSSACLEESKLSPQSS